MIDRELSDFVATLRAADLPATELARVREAVIASASAGGGTAAAPSNALSAVKTVFLAGLIAVVALPQATVVRHEVEKVVTREARASVVRAAPTRLPEAALVATPAAREHDMREHGATVAERSASRWDRSVGPRAASRSAKSPQPVIPSEPPEPPPPPPPVEDRRFELAVALYELELFHASAVVFDAITREGHAHPDFARTLPWLARLADSLPEPGIVRESVARYDRSQVSRFGARLSRDQYAHLLFLLARDRYDDRDLSGAVAIFREVAQGSDHYAPAKLFEGVTHVRMRRARPAIAAFREAIDALEDGRGGDVEDRDRLRDLAWLSLGRVYYTVAHQAGRDRPADARVLGNAIAAWDRIPETSEHWLDAMFEETWALFVSGQHDRALGRIHALESPYFADRHYPEARVVRAVVLFQRCQLDAAQQVVDAFHRRYGPLQGALRRTLARYDDRARAHGLVRSLRRGDAGLDPRVAALLRHAFDDRELEKQLAAITALGRESRAMPRLASHRDVGPHADWLAQELALVEGLAVDRAGELARLRIERLVEDLQSQMNAMDAIQLEIHTDRRRRPEGYARADGDIRIVADQEHVVWPFDGEYWEDELPYYRVQVPDRCTR